LGFKVWGKGKVPCAFVGADYRWVAPSTVIAWAVFGLVALFACKLVIYSDTMRGLMRVSDWREGSLHTRCFLRLHSVQEVKVRWRGRKPDDILSVLDVYLLYTLYPRYKASRDGRTGGYC
jgi:hypothetical protein